MKPKAFISYSWTSEEHRETIRDWADRLIQDGVEVVLDQYDLQHGHDKYAFMERVVTDQSVTHVLVASDKRYATKADAKEAGVGTEAQIMSADIYNKVQQSKFVPLFCEFDEEGNPYLPRFLKNLIGFNFSTPEHVNAHWESLVRFLHGKPVFKKPALGTPPKYLEDEVDAPVTPARSRFEEFKRAFVAGRKGVVAYRSAFFEAWFTYADQLRDRVAPQLPLGEKILADHRRLLPVRDLLADWAILESSEARPDTADAFIEVVEKLLELRSRPAEVQSWNDAWFESHQLFAYEAFLYIVASLMRSQSYELLHLLLTTHFLLPEVERQVGRDFAGFEELRASTGRINEALLPQEKRGTGARYHSPTGELLKRTSTRIDLPFERIMEADALCLMMAAVLRRGNWYPNTVLYAGWGALEFFQRAAQRRHFEKLAVITGVNDPTTLMAEVQQGLEHLGVRHWTNSMSHSGISFSRVWNLEKLGSLA